jgi:hypothetical protein
MKISPSKIFFILQTLFNSFFIITNFSNLIFRIHFEGHDKNKDLIKNK